METKIPEIEAKNILLEYDGSNNQLLEWKHKFLTAKNHKLSRTQSDYVLKYNQVIPKVARKNIKIVISFAERLMEEQLLSSPPETIWCEKLLCESEKAYHIWGKILDTQQNHAIWLPKSAIIQPEKTLKRVIDYSKYDNRPPMAHQIIAIEKLLCNNKFILADDMGVGKTTSAVIAALESDVKKVLIVCPATLKINWKREISMYSNEPSIIVEGKKWGTEYKYYIINYDILKNYHTLEKGQEYEGFNKIMEMGFDLAIIDEAHYVSNATANRTKLLNDILDKIPKVWLLTGTPMTSRPINYFNLLSIIDSPVALNWQQYVYRYCAGYRFTVNGRKIWNTSGASNLDELRERTKSTILRRMKSEILDLPEKIITPVFLELKNTDYDDELEEFMRISGENKKKESLTVTISRLMKIRQLIAYEKLQYTMDMIDNMLEQDKKVIVFTNFTMTVDMLHEKYPKNSVILDGRMTDTKRQVSIDKFQTDPKIKIFIANIIAGGVGITLTAAECVIMNDLSFVPSHHGQAEDRCYRIGQEKNVLVYYPVFENTIEMIIYNILNKKKNIIDQVLGDGEYSEGFSKELIEELL